MGCDEDYYNLERNKKRGFVSFCSCFSDFVFGRDVDARLVVNDSPGIEIKSRDSWRRSGVGFGLRIDLFCGMEGLVWLMVLSCLVLRVVVGRGAFFQSGLDVCRGVGLLTCY